MQKFYRSSLKAFVVLIVMTALAQAQQQDAKPSGAKPEDAPMQMITYQMVIFKAGTPAPAVGAPASAKPVAQDPAAMAKGHLANLARLHNERINLVYGPFTADDDKGTSLQGLAGIAILDVPDAETAKKHFANDPFVKAGAMVLEVKPWLGPKGWFHPPTAPPSDDPAKMVLEPLVFGILVRGPAAKANPPVHTMEQRQELQKGHLAYMAELNKQGKLVMAGPFMEDGDWRGVVVYRVGSVAEAQALAANDPSVKAGRLAIEARSWTTLKGILK